MAETSTSRSSKRKSRFSDAPEHTPSNTSSTNTSNDTNYPNKAAKLDPAEAAKAAAARLRSQTSAPPKQGDALQTRMSQLTKSVQEQLNSIKGIQRPNKSFQPAPLLLDAQGRQIDEHGNPIEDKYKPKTKKNKAANPYLSHRVDEQDKVDGLDPRLKLPKRETRGKKGLHFVKQGTFVKQGAEVRAKEAQKVLDGFKSGRNPRGYHKEEIATVDEEETKEPAAPSAIQVPPKADAEDPTPEIEWWDVDLLPKDQKPHFDRFGHVKAQSRKQNPDWRVDLTDLKLKHCGTAHLIEHPSRVKLYRKQEEEVAVPLMLTPAERKKMNRQIRLEREKEKQSNIALGLLPPPEPKVKLSNMMRVLSEQAVADPSTIEKKVREQMAQREQNHEMRNLARKLTPEERREKKLRKIKEDAAKDIHVAVFKVPELENPQHRFKVDVNAQQHHLTGGALICKDAGLNLVVVEGGPKAVRSYKKLMMRRIKWNEEEEEEEEEKEGNGCLLLWEGIVHKRAFNNFRFQECRSPATARKVMAAKGVEQYWDLCEKASI